MTHLREEEFVDLIENQLSPERARHATGCTDCRAKAEALSSALRAARPDDVPEPSPLFWDQLSTRVSQAIEEPPPSWWSRLASPVRVDAWRLAAAAAASIAVVALTWQALSRVETPPLLAPESTFVEGLGEPELDGFVDAWDAIEAAAMDLDWEDGQSIGIAARPGSAERLVADLTAEERSELARLIEEELKRTGA
jgi:hypothetical protein